MAMRSRTKKWIFAGICFLLAAAVATGAILGFRQSNSVKRFTVVIDPGHGFPDGGATGIVTGVLESDINLQISKKLAAFFQQSEFHVVMTRTNKNALYSGDGFKRGDMLKRKQVILDAEPDLVVSVHLNKFSQNYRKGAQVFFKKSDEDGKRLADSIQTSLNETVNAKNYAALKGDYYILNCTDIPSVIVECGFLSNPEEERNLMSDEYQEKLAFCIYSGIVGNYY